MGRIKEMIFSPAYIHPEEEPDTGEINKNFTDINSDLKYLDSQITNTAENFSSLLSNTKLKLNNIKNILNKEQERQEDINILCNKYSSFSQVKNLNEKDFINSNLHFDNNVISGMISKEESVQYEIEEISGNGHAGNRYVYNNKQFIENVLSTSDKSAINDNNLATVFEYARITESSSEKNTPVDFNKDSIEAECIITLKVPSKANKMILNTDRTDLILKEIYVSDDGINYELDKEYNISLNSNREKYNDQEYIYGSGIISFKESSYIKICLRSNGCSEDTLAYEKKVNNGKSVFKNINVVSTAKRHLIRINNISLFKNRYASGVGISKELISDPVSFIALYCNEYINSDMQVSDMISYSFIINGIEYVIKPINSNINGKKIIRTSEFLFKLDNTEYIKEKIKSARLKIKISASEKATPYISNLKILIGSERNE